MDTVGISRRKESVVLGVGGSLGWVPQVVAGTVNRSVLRFLTRTVGLDRAPLLWRRLNSIGATTERISIWFIEGTDCVLDLREPGE